MRLLILAPIFILLTPVGAEALEVEQVRLPAEAGHQVYNFQEEGPWRVWARSQAGFKASQIWMQRRGADGRWGEAAPWTRSDPGYRDSDPFLTMDGPRLLFISNRPLRADDPPMAHLDLFTSSWEEEGPGAGWSAPRRLSETLQSPTYELGPEQHGDRLWWGSYRAGAPGPLTIYTAPLPDGEPVRALPAPINDGGNNGDPTPSPDGRYLLWWSGRSGKGDLYLAERLAGERHGPALRLPSPVNDEEGFEFTPWISADGQWLYFASTRPGSGDEAGLAKLYRASWPAVLRELGPAAQSASQSELDAANSALWRAISHGANAASDGATLQQLMHPQARIWGSAVRSSGRLLRAMSGEEFIAALANSGERPLQECELAREQRRYGAMAVAYSRVRTDREPGSAPYTGVNSLQWHWDAERGWQLLSLHYALDLPGEELEATGACLP